MIDESVQCRLSAFEKLRNTPLNNEGWFEWELYYQLLNVDRGWKKEKKNRRKNREPGDGVDLQFFNNEFIELRAATTEKTNMSWILQGLIEHKHANAVLFLALYHKNLRKWLEKKKINEDEVNYKDKNYEIRIKNVNEDWVVGIAKLSARTQSSEI
jgi:hypothetical protein